MSPASADTKSDALAETDRRIEELAAMVVDESRPSIVLLAGGAMEDHGSLVARVVERLEGWEQPARRSVIDLEGFEGARLADYLAYQLAKRCPELSEDARGERAEAMLAVLGEQMIPIFDATTLAMLLSLALDTDDPEHLLRRLLELPPIPWESVALADPIVLDHALKTLSESRYTMVRVSDPLLFPTALTGTEVGILSWLALAVERHPRLYLVLSIDADLETEAVVPYSRGGVERIELVAGEVADGAVETLRRRLADEGSMGEAAMDFLVDAALCGPVVPVVPLLDRLGLDEEGREAVEDVLDDVLVADGDRVAVFEDLEFRHPGYPQGVLGEGESTWVYRFRSAALRRALLATLDDAESRERARALGNLFDRRLPTSSRSITRLRAHLSQHLGADERRQALQELARWIQPRQAPFLRAVLERDLRDGKLEAAEVWRAARQAEHRPPLWRLALVEACAVEGERFLEDFAPEELRALRTLLAELRQEVLAGLPPEG